MPVRIVRVLPGSVAQEIGLVAGDHIVAINGEEVSDYVDYLYLVSDGVELLHVKKGSEEVVYEFPEPYPLGVEVEYIKPRVCKCRCIFCFMDQMPKGMRRTLYLKDDDYRLSFLEGSYITLVGMKEEDWRRIERLRLSPLYVSVHTTDPDLRAFMMGHPEAACIMERLGRLVNIGIEVHAQVVVCPGINDGLVLEKTIKDLAGLFPGVRSVAVVPVGLTRYRDGLYPLRAVDRNCAIDILSLVVSMGNIFKKRLGTRFVFPADELFIKAGEEFPPLDFYEDLYQLEDGVGMVPLFMNSVEKVGKTLKGVVFATGVAFASYLGRALCEAGVEAKVVRVRNRFFGDTVTVAGLITGGDLLDAVKCEDGSVVVIPDAMLNTEGLTLDDMRVEQMESESGKRVLVAPSDPRNFWQFLRDL